MDRQGLEGETYHGEYHQQGDPNSREDLNGDPSREELCREDLSRGDLSRGELSRGELCNLVVFHPTSNNCHTGELVAANNNNNNNVQVGITLMRPMEMSTSVFENKHHKSCPPNSESPYKHQMSLNCSNCI